MTDLAQLLAPGQRVFVSGSSNEPTQLLDELRASSLPDHIQFIQFPLAGFNQQDFTQYSDTALFTTFFMTPALKSADPSRLQFLPMQMRYIYEYLSRDLDLVLLQVAYDRAGRLRAGPNVDFVAAALSSGAKIVAELNRRFVAPAGGLLIDPGRVDMMIESDRSLPVMAAPQIDEVSMQIGRHVADLITDGDCIQTGIGAIPAAILQQLDGKQDLGLHGGLIDDGGMALIRKGNVTGRRKTLDPEQHITGMALGSVELLEWLADSPQVLFKGANYTHEASVIRQLDNYVSINSAVEVDLHGQVNAERVGGKQISGTGGSVDFMRAAKYSRGGRSIVAMTATARGGSVSRIVPKVDMVTALRTDVDLVVTEYGVADLRHADMRARQEALVQIAAPQFRSELQDSTL